MPRSRRLAACLWLAGAVMTLSAGGSAPSIRWRPLQPGVELATIALSPGASLYVVRVDPDRAALRVALASEIGTGTQTAAQWCRSAGLSVAINAGMFQSDQRSNVGYLRHGQHLNNARFNDYQSVLALYPAANSKPRLLWSDLDRGRPNLDDYSVVVQNLRLIAGDRRNVWSPSARRWSEAALALDGKGRLLFLFCRAPYPMRDFNDLILKLPLDVTRAMHLEGGPEASLSIHVPGLDLDLCGSYETGFREDDTNLRQWPIPNVLGVAR
jgi:hypothetical protein